jgi:hypothetical protein
MSIENGGVEHMLMCPQHSSQMPRRKASRLEWLASAPYRIARCSHVITAAISASVITM